jgi:SanA protein
VRPGARARGALAAAAGAVVLLAVAVVTANVVVVHRTADRVTGDATAVRPAQVAIVPGSLVRADGSLGPIVEERVGAAVALYRAGRVDAVLMSGDNAADTYNEPDAMRDAALAAGVAPEDVFTDYAGFDTWHTMRRARDVFLVRTAVVVTQAPHAARAVDLARAAGLDAEALVVGDGGRVGREVLARVWGLGEATVRPGVVGGPVVPIGGDGRASWAGADGRAR